MSDIVERLRAIYSSQIETIIELKHEIERLRAQMESGNFLTENDKLSLAIERQALEIKERDDEIERLRAQTVSLTPPELEEAIKHVTAYDDCQIGMLDYSQLWRLIVAARHYIAMLKNSQESADEITRLRAQVVSLQSSLDAGPPRPGKKTPDALEKPE